MSKFYFLFIFCRAKFIIHTILELMSNCNYSNIAFSWRYLKKNLTWLIIPALSLSTSHKSRSSTLRRSSWLSQHNSECNRKASPLKQSPKKPFPSRKLNLLSIVVLLLTKGKALQSILICCKAMICQNLKRDKTKVDEAHQLYCY